MAKKTFRVEKKQAQNKKWAMRLLISLIALMSLYFGCIKAGVSVIQDVYIYAGFLLILLYAFFAVMTAREKDRGKGGDTMSVRARKYNRLSKYALVLFLPMVLSLLLDYMLILLGWAGYLGI